MLSFLDNSKKRQSICEKIYLIPRSTRASGPTKIKNLRGCRYPLVISICRHRANGKGIGRPRTGIIRDSAEIDRGDSLRLPSACLIERLAINTRKVCSGVLIPSEWWAYNSTLKTKRACE